MGGGDCRMWDVVVVLIYKTASKKIYPKGALTGSAMCSASRSPQGSIRLGTASPFGLHQRLMEEVVEAVCSGR